jgi:hypothetical protein
MAELQNCGIAELKPEHPPSWVIRQAAILPSGNSAVPRFKKGLPPKREAASPLARKPFA